MAETLGSLCDKLTIIKLKQWHTDDQDRLASLQTQECRLKEEIGEFMQTVLQGAIPMERLTFAANKVYKKEGNEVGEVTGNMGEIVAQLAHVNCELWHEQEKVYEFEAIPASKKDAVVKALALLNLKRNRCIDAIDRTLVSLLKQA